MTLGENLKGSVRNDALHLFDFKVEKNVERVFFHRSVGQEGLVSWSHWERHRPRLLCSQHCLL